MNSLSHNVHLVDADGFDTSVTEKNGVPHDPADASTWPAWTDNWFWGISDLDELAELEAAATEALTDLADGPPYEPTEEDREDWACWSARLDQLGDFPREVTPTERRQFATDVAEFYRVHPES